MKILLNSVPYTLRDDIVFVVWSDNYVTIEVDWERDWTRDVLIAYGYCGVKCSLVFRIKKIK